MGDVRDLARELLEGAPVGMQLRLATVTATASSPNRVTIKLGGSTTAVANVRYLGWYTPAVDDIVLVLQTGTDLLVLGKREAGGAAGVTDHDLLTGVSADDHHAQAHALDGADHTGTLDDDQIDGTAASQAHTTNTSLWNAQAGTARKIIVYDPVTLRPMWDYLQPMDILEPAQITSFSIANSSLAVASSGTDACSFTLAYQGTPSALSIDISSAYAGAEVNGSDYPFADTTPFTSATGPIINAATTLGASNGATSTITFLATATIDGQTKTASATRSYMNYRITGTSTNAAIDTDAELDGFGTQTLAASRAATFSVTAAANEYIYYAHRSAVGTPTFTVGGFAGGLSLIATVAWSNPRGFTENYQVWRSDNHSLGATTVVVT